MDPKELEERFERATKRGVFGSQNKGKYWELYSEMFAGLAQRPADGSRMPTSRAFAKAYEAKLRALSRPAAMCSAAIDRTASGRRARGGRP